MSCDLDYFKNDGYHSTATCTGKKAPELLRELTGRLADRFNGNGHKTWVNLSAKELFLIQKSTYGGTTNTRGEFRYKCTESSSVHFNIYRSPKVTYA